MRQTVALGIFKFLHLECGTRRTVVMLMLVGVWSEARTKVLSVGLQRFHMGYTAP